MKATTSRRNEQKRVIREAMIRIFALQLQLGASSEDIQAAASNCIADAIRSVRVSRIDDDHSDVQGFGSLLRSWHRDSRFLSIEGFPRHLRLEGRNSLKSLICAHYPRDQFSAVVQALTRAGLIKRDNKGQWFPTTRHAVFPTLSAELLVHFSEGVAKFIETMSRNVTARNKEEVLFERSSKVRKLPISRAPEFRAFVNSQALAFLEAVDDWLENRVEEGKGSRERKCTAGVFAFAFMDDFLLPKK